MIPSEWHEILIQLTRRKLTINYGGWAYKDLLTHRFICKLCNEDLVLKNLDAIENHENMINHAEKHLKEYNLLAFL